VNVPPKLFFLTLLWEFVMFFQLKTTFHYSTDKAKVYAHKNKTSRDLALKIRQPPPPRIELFQGVFLLIHYSPFFRLFTLFSTPAIELKFHCKQNIAAKKKI
jgi:hypothetical protein